MKRKRIPKFKSEENEITAITVHAVTKRQVQSRIKRQKYLRKLIQERLEPQLRRKIAS